jgi:hypothetical protein
MLKCLAILCLLIAAIHVTAQIPRQRGEKQNHPDQDSNSSNKDGQSLAKPTFDPPVAVHDNDGKYKHETAQEKPHYWKEAFDPGTWSNWALVIVGATAGLFAWLTLRKIRRQTDLMNRNNATGLASARAALESAQTANEQIRMMKNKERARIAITVLPLEVLDLDSNGENSVRMQIENLGPTHAHNVRSNATATVVVKGFDRWDPDDLDDLMLPNVIRADAPPIDTYLPFIFLDEWLEEILEWKFKLIIELRGVIAYEDVFGNEHRTKFGFDMKVDKTMSLSRGELWEVKSYYGWRRTHGEDDNKAG